MNFGDSLSQALFVFTVAGALLWWVYVGGAVLAIIAMMTEKAALQDAAFVSLLAQFAPIVAALLTALVAVFAFAVNQMPPFWILMAYILPALAVGPIMTLRLLGRWVIAKLPPRPPADGR